MSLIFKSDDYYYSCSEYYELERKYKILLEFVRNIEKLEDAKSELSIRAAQILKEDEDANST